MFTRDQRKVLNSLSKQVFGTESRWRKMIKDPKFQVVDGSQEDATQKKYVEVQVKRHPSDKRRGTVWTYEKALAKNMLSPETEMPAPVMTKTREPSYEELSSALESNLDMLNLSHVENKEDQSMVFAKRFVDGKLAYKVSLLIEGAKEDFDGLVAVAPEALRETLKNMVVAPDADVKNSTVFDAVTFVSNVVFVASHKEEAELQVKNIMDLAGQYRTATLDKAKKTLAIQKIAR